MVVDLITVLVEDWVANEFALPVELLDGESTSPRSVRDQKALRAKWMLWVQDDRDSRNRISTDVTPVGF